jgi:hypothetical protein
MRTIHKYELEVNKVTGEATTNIVMLPKFYEIVAANEQHRRIIIWADIHTEDEKFPVTFVTVGTGREVPKYGNEMMHIETVFLQNGLVFHIFLDIGV